MELDYLILKSKEVISLYKKVRWGDLHITFNEREYHYKGDCNDVHYGCYYEVEHLNIDEIHKFYDYNKLIQFLREHYECNGVVLEDFGYNKYDVETIYKFYNTNDILVKLHNLEECTEMWGLVDCTYNLCKSSERLEDLEQYIKVTY